MAHWDLPKGIHQREPPPDLPKGSMKGIHQRELTPGSTNPQKGSINVFTSELKQRVHQNDPSHGSRQGIVVSQGGRPTPDGYRANDCGLLPGTGTLPKPVTKKSKCLNIPRVLEVECMNPVPGKRTGFSTTFPVHVDSMSHNAPQYRYSYRSTSSIRPLTKPLRDRFRFSRERVLPSPFALLGRHHGEFFFAKSLEEMFKQISS
jgi:hypothetical protein